MFLYLFGLPAVRKYLAKNVIVIQSKNGTGGIEAPAVTFFGRHNETKTGWRTLGVPQSETIIQAQCGDLVKEDITDCVLNKTLTKEDILKGLLPQYLEKRGRVHSNDDSRT